MRRLAIAALVLTGLCSALQPAPFSVELASANPPLVLAASDCHANVMRHYLREAGRSVRHFHRPGDCRAIFAEPGDLGSRGPADCHRDVREHRLPGSNGPVAHRHVGANCTVRIVRRSTVN